MALLAAVAVAAATWFAAAAQGPDAPLAVLAAVLVSGVAASAARRSTSVLPPGKEGVVLAALTVAGWFVLYMAGWTDRAHHDDLARLAPWAVVALSVLWPAPNVLRYCLALACGALLGATVVGDAGPVPWAVGGAVVALALALVATNRLAAASGPRLAGPATASGTRVAGETAVVLVVVGLLAALAAALVPPPPDQGGGGSGGDRSGEPTLAGPAASGVVFGPRLDLGIGREPGRDEVVFLVDAPTRDVWRATTYDHWDGESWSRSPETLTPAGTSLRPGIGDMEGDGGPGFPQWVTVQATSASILVAAARPTYVSVDTVVRQGADGSLYPAPPLTRGQRYLVSSQRSPVGAEALRAASGAVPDPVADAYLQLPRVAPRVRALAAEAAGQAATPFDTVRALEAWLSANTTVTEEAQPVRAGSDPLETFLLEDRSGPPETTATALAVMLRALGVPARLALGFLPGTRTGPGGEFVVRVRDLHAWVEVWFPGIGWQRFDATGKSPPRQAETDSVWDRLRRLWPLLAVLALAWLAWWGVRWWRRQRARPWATRFLARLERAGAARGRPRQPQETPAEYAGELARTVLPDSRLEKVGDLVTAAAYSRHEPAAEERAGAEEILRAATRAAPLRRLRPVHRWPAPPRPTIRKP
ncbi:MAG TPA: transglutaminaseTgpA domain-containing protein [Acidimicrobiales bacterium]|nr:transglutaminaseTgpA domain-containing protein [Acidimicrobiales bacterium]